VSASYDNTARIWNTATGECKAELRGHLKHVNSAVFSPDGMYIVSASDDRTARIWNTLTRDCKAVLRGHSSFVICAVFSPDGMHIVSVSLDNTAQIWNTVTGECEIVWEGHTSIPSILDRKQLPLVLPIPDGVFIHNNFYGQMSVSFQPSLLDIYNNTIFHTINFHKICVPPPFCNPSTITCYLSKICL
jgi:WD40 repeat protein